MTAKFPFSPLSFEPAYHGLVQKIIT